MENSIVNEWGASCGKIDRKSKKVDLKEYLNQRKVEKFFRYKLHFSLFSKLQTMIFNANKEQLVEAVNLISLNQPKKAIAVFSPYLADKYETSQI
ncbi:hypothetical protein [Flammeovirga aprica]|uniref:Uncharacterized protein n=1 Tax=Flammeovirga aprica JL-4 TaxID=694437 RepID=A0A7X9X9T4_9BACT|nr:hypothetical protein [Flammeovirga aprica]NME69028.1 hypothetical protein [Flammeovirga aprica JL-4]